MTFLKNRLRYSFYVIYLTAVSLCLLYFLFPEKVVKNHIKKRAETIFPTTITEIEKVSPSIFPPGVGIDSVDIFESGNPLIRLDFLGIYPQLSSVFSKFESSYNFYGKAFGGTIEGTYKESLPRNTLEHILLARFKDMSIPGIPALEKYSVFNMSGILDGQMSFTVQRDLEADLNISLSNGKIALNSIYTGQITFFFKRLDSVITLKDSVLNIMQCHLHGKDMDITLSGKILSTWPMVNSSLDLTGFINPHHAFLKKAENRVLGNLFPDKKADDKGFSFIITGTFDKPVFVWN